jgi:hypothetical protein
MAKSFVSISSTSPDSCKIHIIIVATLMGVYNMYVHPHLSYVLQTCVKSVNKLHSRACPGTLQELFDLGAFFLNTVVRPAGMGHEQLAHRVNR